MSSELPIGGTTHSSLRRLKIAFSPSKSAVAVIADTHSDPRALWGLLEISPEPRGVVTVSGGASYFPTEVEQAVAALVDELVSVAFERKLMLIDGGTARGVMQIIGACHAVRPQTLRNGHH